MKNILIFLIIVLINSCNFISASKELNAFMGSDIVIPNELKSYFNGVDTTMDIVDNLEKKLIVYFDPTICSTCEVTHLFNWHEVIAYNKWTHGKFGVVFIFSPKADEYDEIKRTIKNKTDIDAVILLDKNGDFAKQNPQLPKNRNYHIFLLDENNEVVVVGNPMGNEKLWELYKEQIGAK